MFKLCSRLAVITTFLFHIDGVCSEELFVVRQNYPLWTEKTDSSHSNNSLAPLVRRDTLVKGIGRSNGGADSREGWLVQSYSDPSVSGWLPDHVLASVSQQAKQLEASAWLQGQQRVHSDEQGIPEVIALQRQPALEEAWKIIAISIVENSRLPVEEQLGDPYFARAEIWLKAESFSEALHDYLDGFQIVRSSGRSINDYRPSLDKMSELLEKIKATPVPKLGNEPERYTMAKTLFSRGYNAYRSSQLSEAAEHFSSALAFAPAESLYWYFRAITNYLSGDLQRAQHDAVMGAYFERNAYPEVRRHVTRGLSNVQGSERVWVEKYRRGMPRDG
jgi:tetratricopeptide (TPR) repeat protein